MPQLFIDGRSPEKLHFLADDADRLIEYCVSEDARASLTLISQGLRSAAERAAFKAGKRDQALS